MSQARPRHDQVSGVGVVDGHDDAARVEFGGNVDLNAATKLRNKIRECGFGFYRLQRELARRAHTFEEARRLAIVRDDRTHAFRTAMLQQPQRHRWITISRPLAEFARSLPRSILRLISSASFFGRGDVRTRRRWPDSSWHG